MPAGQNSTSITPNQIGIDSVEAIECLKSWMRKNNINFIDNEVEDLVSLSEPV